MFRAINEWVIVKRDLTNKTTTSGIIITPSDDQIMEFEVVSTTEMTEGLEGKTILAERHRVRQLTPESDVKYGAIKLEDILAIKE